MNVCFQNVLLVVGATPAEATWEAINVAVVTTARSVESCSMIIFLFFLYYFSSLYIISPLCIISPFCIISSLCIISPLFVLFLLFLYYFSRFCYIQNSRVTDNNMKPAKSRRAIDGSGTR